MKTDLSRFSTAIRYLAVIPLIVFGLLGILASGGGGGGGSSSTAPTDVPFQLFPAGYFSTGYTKTWHLSGSDTDGLTYTATITFTTGAQTTFNSLPAIPIQEVLSLTETTSGLTIVFVAFQYYSTDPTSRMFLGWTNDGGDVFTGTSLSIIPQSATIGTSPINLIGTYLGSGAAAGETETQTWQLTNANNGLANFITVATLSNGSGILFTETVTTVIDQQGNGQSVTDKLADSTGWTITLSGS